VRAILERRRAKPGHVAGDAPAYTLIRDRARGEVLLQLTPEQERQYRRILEDMDKQSDKADSTWGRRDESS
jgi:hypothetical protein